MNKMKKELKEKSQLQEKFVKDSENLADNLDLNFLVFE